MCKSISRVLFSDCSKILSFISILIHIKTLSIYPPRNPTPKSGNRTSSSSPGAYLIFQPIRFALPPPSLSGRWALTPPFHPYPNMHRDGLFSVALSVTNPSPDWCLPVRKYGALCCPDFPPRPDSYRDRSDKTTCTPQIKLFCLIGFYFLCVNG